jgi:hypothetical protein
VTGPAPSRLIGAGARLDRPAGSLDAGVDLEFFLDDASLTLSGGDPPSVWQIPRNAMVAPRARLVGEYVELSAWVAGSRILVTIPVGRLNGCTGADVIAQFDVGAVDEAAHLEAERREDRRMARRATWLVASAVGVVVLVVILVVALVVGSSPSSTSNAATAHARALARSMNLKASDVPGSWGQDSPLASPLSGLLGTGPSSKPTAESKKLYNEVVGSYQACMGESNATDRMFGAAGVQPVAQVAGDPYGTVVGNNLIEVGTVTQIYASTADVHADLGQMKKAVFPKCFSQAMAKFTIVGTDPTQAKSSPPVSVEPPRTVAGTYISGATATVQVPAQSGNVPIEIGVTVIINGLYEQTLYTFASPGGFPRSVRLGVESAMAARLAGISGATSA